MKKKIIILGSTGSIGQTALRIIYDKKKLFIIETLLANKNYKKICYQIDKFKPKNFIIANKNVFLKVKKKYLNKKVNIYNDFEDLKNKKKKSRYNCCSYSRYSRFKTYNFFRETK